VRRVKQGVLVVLTLALIGCGGGAGGGAAGVATQPSTPSNPALPSNTVTGAAATGEALGGASVVATDASGDSLDVAVTTTTSGRFSFAIPRDVTYPVVVTVTATDGTVVRTIIGSQPADDSEGIVAHVTPLTEAASGTFLDDPDAPPLDQVSGEDFDAAGQEIVTGLFGASVQFDTFSSDPGFIPANPNLQQPPSVSDTMLDTVARAAGQAGEELMDFVAAQSTADAKLMQQPRFQVQLVGELSKKGNAPEELVEKLTAVGAVSEDAPDAETTLWAAAEGVPKALAAAKEASGKDDARLDDAMIETLATLTEERVAQGGAEAAANTLKSESVQGSVAEVVSDAMAVWLDYEPENEEEAAAIEEIAKRAGSNAGKVVAGLSDEALATDAGKQAAAAVVKNRAVPQDVAGTKAALAEGSTVSDLTPDAGPVASLQDEIEEAASESGGAVDLFQPIPGNYDQASFDQFDWT